MYTCVTTFAVVWIEILKKVNRFYSKSVTTLAVVWIEIPARLAASFTALVTTFAVVWIEIVLVRWGDSCTPSPPSRWCGLKYYQRCKWRVLPLSPPSRWCGLK